MTIPNRTMTRGVWGGTYAHLCGLPVQAFTSSDGRQGLFDAGNWQRHSCGPIRQHPCGEFVTRWRDGSLVNTADDQPHVCGETRVLAKRVLVPIARPVNAVANQPAPPPPTAEPEPPRRSIADLLLGDDDEEDAA